MITYQRKNLYSRLVALDNVDGQNQANRLRLVVYPIIYGVLYIPGWLFGISSINSISTPLKNISQNGNLPQIKGENHNVISSHPLEDHPRTERIRGS